VWLRFGRERFCAFYERPVVYFLAFVFWATVLKRFALCHRTVVLSVFMSVLSVTLVYCGQTVGWIKIKLDMPVGLSPSHIVLAGTPAPPPKKKGGAAHRPIFGPCLLCVLSTIYGTEWPVMC